MRGQRKGWMGLVGKGAAALFVVMGTTALVSSSAQAVKKPVIFKGHVCTSVATSKHPNAVGRGRPGHPAVVCGVSGNDTLRAAGKGPVILIAGPGHDTLKASNARGAHDVLIGSTGGDTFVTGTSGTDEIILGAPAGDTVDCTTTGTITIAGDDQGDNSNGDCQPGGNVEDASQEWQGVITATDATSTMTIQWTDANDAAQAWLAPLGDPASVTFDITTADIQVEGGGPLATGQQVDVTSDGVSSGIGLVALSVDAGATDGQGDSSCPSGTVTGTVEGDLTVAVGSCTISGADIQGDVTVGAGASATISNSTIEGDLNCDGSVTDGGGNSIQGDVGGGCPTTIGGGSSGDN
jgi:hypothetical protein